MKRPQGHHADLRARIGAFTSALLASDPPIAGLHESVIVNPRRLHLTLGVMSLAPEIAPPASTTSAQGTQDASPKTLSEAVSCLNSIRPRILEELRGDPLQV
jgi:activating signal cointegrator complex subunit 1